MKKKLLSIVLCIAMLFTFSASGALAEEIETENQTNTEQNIEMNVDDSNQDVTEGNPVDDEIGDVNTDENQSSEEGTDISDENTDSNTDTDTEDEISDTPQNPQEGSDVVPEDSDLPTGSQDYSTMSTEELYAYIMQLGTDEEVEAVLAELPQETIDALVAYAQEQAMKDYVPPETVVFTEAGPFLPPVSVTIEQQVRNAMRRMVIRTDNYALNALDAAIDAYTDEGNGLKLSKEVVSANDDGSYTIRMEAYTTGTVTTSTKTVPVDIVLVLDQSGSMAYDFNGDRRQYAMKQAVNNFIDAVAKKYTGDADHRMAIVTFGSSASVLQGWTYVNESGMGTLQGKINDLPDSPEGATNVAAGMSQAESLMGSGYSYTGLNTQRQKVVIVFTDGVPTTNTDFDTTVATNAIASAKKIKEGGATVYTVGIFTGANPAELYGSSGFDTNSDGTVESKWIKDTWGLFPGTDFPEADRPAGNRFLNYLSSNFPDAESIGLERATSGLGILHYKITYTINKNFNKSKSDYYLTANNSDSLYDIFQTISDNIQTANIDLGRETVIKDTVSQYFDLPAKAEDIKLYTAAAKADGTFDGAVPASGVTATIANNAVSVTGFDFNANFVSDKLKEDNTYGKKLIIEFDVTPKDEFIGGNDVPTNDWKKTAVYDKDGIEVEKFANASTTPTVNVPIKSPVFSVNDKTIYEGNSTVVSGLYTLPATTGWQFDYVNVTVSGVNSETVSPPDCTDYTINVNYAPKTNGNNSKGEANTMDGNSAGQTATVHVLKHDVTATVNDVQKYYGESYTLGDGITPVITVEWIDTNSHTGIPAAEGTAPYTENDLTLSYAASGYNGTVPKADFDVTVTVKKDETEISDAKIITNCTFGCTNNREDGKYKVHVETCQLTVAKTGGASDEPYVFTVKKDNQPYSEITIVGNSSKTVYELPVGNYSIEEDTGWGWRYTPVYSSSVTLGSDNPSDTINCTNRSEISKWLNGFSSVVKNIYGSANQ